MKKLILTLVVATAFTTLSAQTEPVKKSILNLTNGLLRAGGTNHKTYDRGSPNCSGKSLCC
jgi:hypothetical protein